MDIFLNSKTCDRKINNETSDCYFHLPSLEVDVMKERVFIKVKSASIPYSFYNVNDYNNILDLTIDAVPRSFTIPSGNYNINSLLIEINLLLLSFGVILTYILKTNHILITSAFNFSFMATSTVDEILGFADNVQYNATILPSGFYELESVNGINLFGVRQIYISSDNFQLDNMSNHNPRDKSTLLAVLVNGNPNSIINYSDLNTEPHEIHNVNNLTNLHIKLTDELSRPLLLNRTNWSLTLSIIFKKRN